MKLDIHKHADEYWHNGWTSFTALDRAFVLDLQRKIISAYDDVSSLRISARREGVSSGGGPSRYFVVDGFNVTNRFGELVGLYHGMLPLLRHITGQNLIASPFARSAINIKVYAGKGSGQGWHYDSNPVTLLLFLSDGAPLEFEKPDGGLSKIRPQAGKIVLMRGKECRHRVPPRSTDRIRISVPMNLYTPDDCSRPDWLDSAIYENAEIPTSTLDA